VKDVTLLRHWVINMLAACSTFSIITRNSVVTHYQVQCIYKHLLTIRHCPELLSIECWTVLLL